MPSPDPDPGPPTAPARFSRRRLLVGGLGAAGVAAAAGGTVAGLELSGGTAGGKPAAGGAPTVVSFRSRPDLAPPRVQMTLVGAPTAESFFLSPNFGPGGTGAGQQGLLVLDGRGEVVWFQPLAPAFSNFQVQSYRGRPVLTWWQGAFNPAGFGEGTAVVADTRYDRVATVQAGNGLKADLHEFVLTPDGTALITAWGQAAADLRPVGGPADGSVYFGEAQEIDVATGKLTFAWRSTDHVGVDETYASVASGPFDYFHINSITVDPDDGNLVISARNTWAVYKVDRATGAVVWRLGGRRSDFALGPGASFAWQHDARPRGRGLLTVFDDGASPTVQPQSRALVLALDPTGRTARLAQAFAHPARLLADNQGNLQLLPDGGALVGWGSEPYFSHFSADGALLRDGRMPTNMESYRAFRAPWSARPAGAPDIATETDDVGGVAVYVSWNGATDVATWQVLSGTAPTSLTEAGAVPKVGFETAITVHPTGPYVAVRGLDARGNALGTSRAVRL